MWCGPLLLGVTAIEGRSSPRKAGLEGWSMGSHTGMDPSPWDYSRRIIHEITQFIVSTTMTNQRHNLRP